MRRSKQPEIETDDTDMPDTKIAQIIRENITWIAGVTVALSVQWASVNNAIETNQAQIKRNEEAIERCCDFGPDGFNDPAAHGSHDLHSEHWHKQVFGVSGWRKLVNDYTTANGAK